MKKCVDPVQAFPRRRFLQQTGGILGAFFLLSEIPPWFLSAHRRSYVERSFYSMGSVGTVCAYGENRQNLNHILTKVIEEFQRLDGLLSVYQPASELSAINTAAGTKLVPVGMETLELLSVARTYYAITHGAFDVTIEPLMRLWGFRGERLPRVSVPSDSEIRATLEGIGMHQVEIDLSARAVGLKSSRSKLDFGGIAVGYAVDRAVALMRSEGIESAFINHSGDAYALGAPEGSTGWRVAIPDPMDRSKILTTLELCDRAVATSGNHEKYVMIDGGTYGHILNPETGFPTDAMLSATIVAASALQADVLSTGCYALGQAEALRLVEGLNDVGFLSAYDRGGHCGLLHAGFP